VRRAAGTGLPCGALFAMSGGGRRIGGDSDVVETRVKRLVVIALVVLSLALAVLLVASHSWAAALEWFMNPPDSSPCGCIYESGANG
jgi:hypothetical protein